MIDSEPEVMMASPLYRDLAHRRADIVLYQADVNDALQRLPERVFLPGFDFEVTAHHLTRFVHRHVRQLRVTDGCVDCFKKKYRHSWLQTPTPDYIIDISPIGVGTKEPLIIAVGSGSIWGRFYALCLDGDKTDYDAIDRDVDALVRLTDGAQQFLSTP